MERVKSLGDSAEGSAGQTGMLRIQEVERESDLVSVIMN